MAIPSKIAIALCVAMLTITQCVAKDRATSLADPSHADPCYTSRSIDACSRLIKDAPVTGESTAKLYQFRAFLYETAGKIAEAIADYETAIKLAPQWLNDRIALCMLFSKGGDVSQGIQACTDLIQYLPQLTTKVAGDAYQTRASLYLKVGDRQNAIADLEKATAFVPLAGSIRWQLSKLKSAPGIVGSPFTPTQHSESTTTAIAPKPHDDPSGGPLDVGKRVALVIGNSKYKNVPVLANPSHDAELVAEVLRRTGFEKVTLLEDLNKDAMVNALRNFVNAAETADWAVIYYAGHGMEVGGVNYLIPVDAKLATDRDINFEAVQLDQLINAAERASKLRLVILDACRDNPFKNQTRRTLAAGGRSVSWGLAPMEPDAGTLVVYAAKGGEKASDGEGDHGPFATAFVKDVVIPGLEVRRLFDIVRDDVLVATNHEQQPFSYGSISGRQDFYFVAPVATERVNFR